MSIVLSLWHFLPWYTWPLLAVAGVALVYVPGALTAFVKITRLVPWPVYAIVAAGLAGGWWLTWHDDELVATTRTAAIAERDKYWLGREDAANKLHEAALHAVQLKLTTALNTARAAAAAHAAQLAAERTKRKAAEAELEKARTTNVTPEADRLCVLTRGIVLQYNVAASVANGEQPPDNGGAARSGGVNAPSGVAVSQLSAAIDAGARAYAAARERITDLETHYATVTKPWIASTLEALQQCNPKGATP